MLLDNELWWRLRDPLCDANVVSGITTTQTSCASHSKHNMIVGMVTIFPLLCGMSRFGISKVVDRNNRRYAVYFKQRSFSWQQTFPRMLIIAWFEAAVW